MPQNTTILYIEDNADNQRLVRRVLEGRGYDVLLAADGPAGLATARETLPALILVDINIPGLDGHATTTRLRSMEHLRGIPIVALTADGRALTRERSLVAGCDGHIVKPIDARRFHEQIQEFISGKREALTAVAETAALREYTRELVERLEHQVAELQELDRLKSQFLAMLSHELRTPLTAILGYIELLEGGTLGAVGPHQAEAIGVIRRQSHLLSRQVNSLLYLQEVRSTQLKRVSINLADLVRRAVTELQPRAGAAGVEIQAHLPGAVPFGGDAHALEHTVRHLVDNAIKFTPARGRVLVQLSDEPAQVVLRVEDTGIGIPADLHEKIFQPFFRVDGTLAPIEAGVGIGLAIVKHAVEAHNGEVVVHSAPGRGTAMTVVLPRT
jgi:signal transduction histidine kinase